MRKPGRAAWILVTITLGSLGAPAQAAVVAPSAAQRAVLEAQTLAGEGRETEAEARLRQALGECAQGADGLGCRVQLGFALGAFAEQRAGAEPADRQRWLGSAVARYQRVLAESPAHAPTLARLSRLHAQQGDRAKAEALLDDALRRFPDQEPIALLLGDLHRDAKSWDAAISAYRVAVDRHPTSDPPRRRLVEAYAALLPARLDEFRRVLAELERGFPAVTEVGHRAIIERLHVTNPAAAEASLVQLVGVLAAMRRLSAQSLDTLPSGWIPPAVTHLRAYLAAPQQRPAPGWWLDRIERRHVLAAAGLALGHQVLIEPDPAGAAARWETAERFAPEYEAYSYPPLKGLSVVRLDLETALALHYFKFPSLDPGEGKFNRAINRIFQSKAGAYQLDDLEGIQRHHTILGVIFAQKGVWRANHFALNAIFQLDNALKTAARRDTKDGAYQPLPELRALLARGYQTTGDTAKARTTYLAATRAYLDTDAIEPAGRMLQSARALPEGASSERELAAQLERVLGTRADVARASGRRLDPAAAEYAFRPAGRHAWLYGGALPALAPEFLDRQRFKTLSDLAVRVDEAGHAPAATELAARAFRTAIENVKHFTGSADVVRIQKIRPSATQQRVLDRKPLVLGSFTGGAPAGAKTWRLTDPLTLRPTQVRLDGDDVLAARIVRELRADPALQSADYVVKGGQVTVREGSRTEEVKSRIEKLPGVDAVRVTPKLPAKRVAPASPATKK